MQSFCTVTVHRVACADEPLARRRGRVSTARERQIAVFFPQLSFCMCKMEVKKVLEPGKDGKVEQSFIIGRHINEMAKMIDKFIERGGRAEEKAEIT